jgi:hypothetical protein
LVFVIYPRDFDFTLVGSWGLDNFFVFKISLYELDCCLLMFVEGARMVLISRLTPSGKFLKNDRFNVVLTMVKKLSLSRDGNDA